MTRERFGGYGREQGADLIAPDNFETKEVPSVSCIELTIAHNLNISQGKKWSTELPEVSRGLGRHDWDQSSDNLASNLRSGETLWSPRCVPV